MIEVNQVSRIDAGQVRVHPVSCRLAAGTVTGIIGPNGAGKSTLLSLMAGELAPTTGEVALDGRPLNDYLPMELARCRAVMAQETPAVFSFAVRDVVSWGRLCWQRTPARELDDAVIDAALADQGITHVADRPITTLSGGERARTHLARVLAQETAVLFLDEADADLDLAGRTHLDAVVHRLQQQGRTVVLVSHDLSWVRSRCDHVILMRQGHAVHMGTAHGVMTAERIADVFGVDRTVAQRAIGEG